MWTTLRCTAAAIRPVHQQLLSPGQLSKGSRRAYTRRDKVPERKGLRTAGYRRWNTTPSATSCFSSASSTLQHQEVILTPHTKEDNNRYLMNTIKDKAFILWATSFFSKGLAFRSVRVSLRDMALSYLDSRKDCNPTNKLMRTPVPACARGLRTTCRKYGFVFNPLVVYNDKRKPKDWEQRTRETEAAVPQHLRWTRVTA